MFPWISHVVSTTGRDHSTSSPYDEEDHRYIQPFIVGSVTRVAWSVVGACGSDRVRVPEMASRPCIWMSGRVKLAGLRCTTKVQINDVSKSRTGTLGLFQKTYLDLGDDEVHSADIEILVGSAAFNSIKTTTSKTLQ